MASDRCSEIAFFKEGSRMKELHPIFYQNDPARLIGWEDRKRNRSYRRLFGGLAWPQLDRPGFAVIVAEGLPEEAAYRMPDHDHVVLYVLREAEGGDFEQLMRFCMDHSGKVAWHGNVNDKTNIRLLYEFNRTQSDAGRLQLKLMPAPYISSGGDLAELFDYGIRRITSLGKEGTLILTESPMLKARLDNVPRDKEIVNHAEEYPGLLALCFAVSALCYYPCVGLQGKGKPGRALTEYDPLSDPVNSEI